MISEISKALFEIEGNIFPINEEKKSNDDLATQIKALGLNPEGKTAAQMRAVLAMADFARNKKGKYFPRKYIQAAKGKGFKSINWKALIAALPESEDIYFKGIIYEAKTTKELKDLLTSFGVEVTKMSNSDMEKLLAKLYWAKEHPNEEQDFEEFEAMLASSKAEVNRDWVNTNFKDTDWWIQIKQDGMRSLLQLDGNKFRMTSRNRSVKNFMLITHQDAVLGFVGLKNPFKGKTVLDGELIAPTKSIPTLSGTTTTTQLQATVALVNMPVNMALDIQREKGSLRYVVYDILYFDGEDVQNLSYEKREELLNAAVKEIKKLNPEAPIRALETIKTYDDPWEIFQKAVADNEEGLMFKKRSMKYQQGKRVAGQQKLKAQNTIDGFITGFIKSTKGGRNQDVIGGIIVSAYVDGKVREIANISGLSDEDRKKMTVLNADGEPQLKDEYYNVCVQMTGNNWSRTGKLVHPRLDDWRYDKQPSQCKLSAKDITGADR